MPPSAPPSPRAPRRYAVATSLVGVAALLALGGCGGGSAPATFDLSAAPFQGRPAVGGRSLVVNEPVALQTFESDRIIVKEPSGGVSFLGGGQWADRLPRLIQTRLIQSLENASRLTTVSRPGDRVASDFALVTEIRDFQVQTDTGEAVVSLSAKIVNDRTNRVIAGRVFTARTPATSIDAAGAAAALDRSLGIVLADVVRWITSGR